MLYLPSLRRLLLPSLVCLVFVLAYRSSHRINRAYLSSLLVERATVTYPSARIKVGELSTNRVIPKNPDDAPVSPPRDLYYDFVHDKPSDQSFQSESETRNGPIYVQPADNVHLKPLLECKLKPNRFTQHIRLPINIQPISMTVNGDTENEKRVFLNPAPLSLPYWSENQYLLVTRVLTDGSAQINIVCEANVCYTDEREKRPNEQPCTQEDLEVLNGTAGMRCVAPPLTLNVPPTPAKQCAGDTAQFMDIPGFHDPRTFWSERGEPLMIMNSQSQYACFGLWVIDMRQVHSPLNKLLESHPKLPTLGPLMSYPYMTEITRNPPETRSLMEKNWFFFSTPSSSYVHYDVGPTIRTFAQLLGSGFTTQNLTDPYEQPCLAEGATPQSYEVWGASWHQGTNSLRLVLCNRSDLACQAKPENTVFWSLIHHKHKNVYLLPLRYERYFIVWSSTPPFHMLAMSSHPMIFANETVSGWNLKQTWDDDAEHHEMIKNGGKGKGDFAVFTYTPSIAYAWGRHEDNPQDKNLGYLDDEVILGIGIDDEKQAFARAKVSDLLQCMRACPGRAKEKLSRDDDNSKSQNPLFASDQENRNRIQKGLAEGKALHEIIAEKNAADGIEGQQEQLPPQELKEAQEREEAKEAQERKRLEEEKQRQQRQQKQREEAEARKRKEAEARENKEKESKLKDKDQPKENKDDIPQKTTEEQSKKKEAEPKNANEEESRKDKKETTRKDESKMNTEDADTINNDLVADPANQDKVKKLEADQVGNGEDNEKQGKDGSAKIANGKENRGSEQGDVNTRQGTLPVPRITEPKLEPQAGEAKLRDGRTIPNVIPHPNDRAMKADGALPKQPPSNIKT